MVRAANPGPMTLDGTNTWIISADSPGTVCLVIDPGPLLDNHLATVAAVASAQATRVLVTSTHGHPDHVEGMRRFLDICPCARLVAPQDDSWRIGAHTVTVLPTPGHTADSVSFVVSGPQPAVLTGDTILGRGTTVVAYPDGDLGAYLDSLRRLAGVGPVPVLPGHGPALTDCRAAAEFTLAHRQARLEQVREAAASLRPDRPREEWPAAIVATVYADVDRALWPAAELSVRAQLAYLADTAPGVDGKVSLR